MVVLLFSELSQCFCVWFSWFSLPLALLLCCGFAASDSGFFGWCRYTIEARVSGFDSAELFSDEVFWASTLVQLGLPPQCCFFLCWCNPCVFYAGASRIPFPLCFWAESQLVRLTDGDYLSSQSFPAVSVASYWIQLMARHKSFLRDVVQTSYGTFSLVAILCFVTVSSCFQLQ